MNDFIVKRSSVAILLAALLFGCATADPWETVAVGDSREQVVKRLGAPIVPERDLTGEERQVLQAGEDVTDRKGAEGFSIWRQGDDRFEIVGFDKNGVVTVKRRFFYHAP